MSDYTNLVVILPDPTTHAKYGPNATPAPVVCDLMELLTRLTDDETTYEEAVDGSAIDGASNLTDEGIQRDILALLKRVAHHNAGGSYWDDPDAPTT